MFDHESLLLMLQALAICLVLTGIHGYLGIHVLERKVIFVDLAMAQIAALGATYALALGYDAHEHPVTVYVFSLGFTLAGAAVFSLTRMRHEKVPQEAFIGIIYATASALAILILARSTTAGEHLKGMLVGNILLARWPKIVETTAIYSAIGAFHWFFRDRFFRISLSPEAAFQEGLNVRLWDFFFYATFGVVITSSVAIAGVLLVFSFLVVPACIGVMFAEKPLRRILVAWGAGTAVSILGIFTTFQQGDFPPGPVVVAAFAVALAVSGVVRYVKRAPQALPALARVGAGAGVLAAVVFGSYLVRKPAEAGHPAHHDREFDQLLEEIRSDDENRQLHAIDHFLSEPDPHAVPPLLELLEKTKSDRVIEHLAATLGKLGDPRAAPALRRAADRPGVDAALRLVVAEKILELKDRSGLDILLALVQDASAPPFPRAKGLGLFERMTGRSFGYKVGGDPRKLEAMRGWWKEHGDHIRWRESTGRFE